jgi:hypothetical protein
MIWSNPSLQSAPVTVSGKLSKQLPSIRACLIARNSRVPLVFPGWWNHGSNRPGKTYCRIWKLARDGNPVHSVSLPRRAFHNPRGREGNPRLTRRGDGGSDVSAKLIRLCPGSRDGASTDLGPVPLPLPPSFWENFFSFDYLWTPLRFHIKV